MNGRPLFARGRRILRMSVGFAVENEIVAKLKFLYAKITSSVITGTIVVKLASIVSSEEQ
jgi:hypothetical protein